MSSSANGALPLGYLDRLSVFETLRVYRGRVFCCERHVARLAESCRALNRPLPLPQRGLTRWLEQGARESGFPDASLRVSVHWDGADGGRLLLFARPFTAHPREWYEKGIVMTSAVSRRPSLKAQDAQIKSSQYVSGVLAMLDRTGTDRREAAGAHELLFLGPGGTVAEGTVSNLFIVKGKSLLTPSVGSGILKGVTRSVVVELAAKRGWPVTETELTRHEFYSADECFLTNTSSEILPVVKLDGRLIGDGKPGPRTRALAGDFKKLR